MKIRCRAITLFLVSATGCAGDLDDPTAFSVVTASPLIRQPGVEPQSPSSPGPTAPTSTPGPADPPPPPATMPPEPELPASCDRTPYEILTDPMRCGGAACHTMPALEVVDFAATPNTLFGRLATTDGEGACAGIPLIDLANPTQSMLLTKMSMDPPCGVAMPYFEITTIPAEEVQCLTDWVVAGAMAASP